MPAIKPVHPLSAFEPILELANERVTKANYLKLVFGFLPPSRLRGIAVGVLGHVDDPSLLRRVGNKVESPFPIPFEVVQAIKCGRFSPVREDTVESVLTGCYILAGESIELGALAQLQGRIGPVLVRHLDGHPDPLLDGTDFIVRGRHPLSRPRLIRAADGGFDPDTNDLHDIWFGYLSSLIASLDEGQDLVLNRGSRRTVRKFRPLARCPSCRRFFFNPGGDRQFTCGLRRCVDRRAHRPRSRRSVASVRPS